MQKAALKGAGSALPDHIISNADLENIVDTSDEWITKRSGIRQRHMVSIPGQNKVSDTTSSLAIRAAQKALENAKIDPAQIDGIIVATTTPDHTFPSVATMVQAGIGAPQGVAFDIQAVCSGFVYGLSIIQKFIESGQCKTMLLIGSETMSRILDWEDRATCVLFGDGAGAMVFQANENYGGGIIGTHLTSDGTKKDLLHTTGGPSLNGNVGVISMQGREVFKNAVSLVKASAETLLKTHSLGPSDIDWIVPHQANSRIIEATADKMGISMDRVIVTVDRHGNTSAASIPLAFDLAWRDGRIGEDDLVLFEAIGGGLTWGSALLRI